MKIRKAVFPVAGLGTRFLPATKAMPKELLPIVDKPIIQFAVEEAIQAGIETMIFVTGRNKRAVEDHFDANLELEYALAESDKTHYLDLVQNQIPEHVECIFVRQPKQLGLGHAVLCAQRAVGDEPFAVLLADDFILPKDEMTYLVGQYNANPSTLLSVIPVPDSQVDRYGIVSLNDQNEINGLIEKPQPADAPSNLASIGRYILQPEIFKILAAQEPGYGGEIQLADAIHQLAQSGQVRMHEMLGKRFDCGSKRGYLEAIMTYAATLEDYQDIIRNAMMPDSV
mgnify:CR=1 FL=1|tara:strand:- start:184 stop:1035 length:852 start_codon:yes stop_codon:yes gene_type:complete